ncbi:MarR family winged helix-turn-helix transcriptional regulator [Pseudomonadota bacterium]|uniref:MarR family winged helix-turn-helix transcriptional regulator n=1 Tax=unclassified Shewanella TaxID=196818 RepID=UPI000C84F7F6|nr:MULTISPECIES: MarR family transcriptional regulator [unclassified Shewanella]MDO6619971.1 MarR family transcriptional regulator [Shewanella sp. 6_MG-2023]MDO6639547.1 MarR family transcriptional regulator [Shewanella sp. 5_MG-2023]MDO6678012.1 MarR family transcriptional regulator [Shewanella sp. 4_MG-2023]MDO6775144.1 MarR family transcriptional regulator [Shewanella sp. 3_MG-2023]PMG30516.1 MarR family transcriptional regulator [Shewanella sp. 10N.286.52.C2]
MKNLQNLNHLLTEFYDKMASWEQSVVKETGYSLAQTHTIEVLGNHGPLRMKELAQKLAITTGTLTVQVDKLVQAQLIERCAHPDDRRSIVVVLTEAGQVIHRQHNQLHLDLVADLSRNIDPEHLQVLQSCLAKMNQEF